MKITPLKSVAAVLALAALAGVCGGGDDDGTAAAATTATTVAASASSDTTDDVATGTVSANDASIAELTAAFEAAGIPSADRWAREVDEYRPYDENDPTMAKLRQELAKYNPSDEVVDQIVATLTLP